MRRLGRLGQREGHTPDGRDADTPISVRARPARPTKRRTMPAPARLDVRHVGRPHEDAGREVRPPVRHQAGGDLHVELQAVGAVAEPEGLILVGVVAGQAHRALGQVEGVAVPVHAGQRRGRRTEDRVTDGLGRQVDLAHAVLGRRTL